jgi:hypothetical protein
VNTWRHAVRQANAGDWWSINHTGIDDLERRAGFASIDDQTDEPTIVLGRIGAAGHEHEFASHSSRAERMGHTSPGREIMLE